MVAGAITYSHVGGQLAYSAFASGSVLADIDAILTIECGFQPTMIELFGTSTNESYFRALWVKGMTAGTFLHTVAAGTTALVATYGPIVFAGDAATDKPEGFQIPVDFQDATGLNMADSDVIYWIAYR